MRENIYFYFMHTHILFILSLVLLWFNNTSATSIGHQLVPKSGRGAVHKCIDKERQALLYFKAQLHDPKDCLSTWRPEEADCCKWSGVGCNNQTGHVTKLDPSCFSKVGGGLVGEISFSLLNLTYIKHLDLSGNYFHGTISLLNLTYLKHLDLSGNYFHGTIPEFICSMTNLTFLSLSENEFTGTIPESISNMTQLTHLDLSENYFSGTIPMSIDSLTQLTSFGLRMNQFTGIIPESIGNMTQLTNLDLYWNNFSGVIPMSIGSLTKLTELYLSYNSFYGTIPTDFGNLTNLLELSLINLRSCRVENLDWLSSFSTLTYLYMDEISLANANNWVNVIIGVKNLEELSLRGCDLSHVLHPYSSSVNSSLSITALYLDNNNLNSSIYRWLCPVICNRLIVLSLSGNNFDEKLSDFLNNLSGCTSATFEALDASNNRFTGSLSDEIQNFSSLIYLNLSSNQLDRTISDKLWQHNLQILDLSSNSLRGAISENIGKPNLWYINLSNNSLEGALFKDDLSNLSHSIEYIDFSSNKLGPRFPKWIQKLKNLRHLDLSRNNISDTVSIEYWNQWQSSQLIYLDLSFNNISGRLPESLSNHHLDIIILSVNNFYGPIPAFPASIIFLDLSRNKFHGRISFLCQMYQNLEFLDLSRNTITGQLPDCFRNLTYLKVLNLGENTLSGSIPPSVGCLGQLKTLSLYNNFFSGTLPVSLKNCTQLSILDLGDNSLYGDIPVWIGKNLSTLYALSLKSNIFFGSIPSQICQLASLQILDLSDNKLYGTIPSCVNSLTSMVQKGLFLEQNVHHYHSYRYGYLSVSGSGYSVRSVDNSYIDHLLIEWQGKVNEFSSILGLLKVIDLSSNNLTGQIPNEVTNLHGLLVLDLSDNSLNGEIPRDIGQLSQLLTLNLSRNMFSGEMPSSMSDMHSLNDLDVSFNNLSGRVPSSTQLQSFPPEWFTGNAELCGLPTRKTCLTNEDLGVPNVVKSESDELTRWFYVGGAIGFATGFWIVCSALLLNRRGRRAFFHFHDSVKDWVYVTVAVFIGKWRRVVRA